MTETNSATGGSNLATQPVCRTCRQPIPAGAVTCTQCGASQTLWGRVAVGLKWAGGVATIVSLVIGMNSIYGIFSEAIDGGFNDWDNIKRDRDLDALREHPDFKRLVAGR